MFSNVYRVCHRWYNVAKSQRLKKSIIVKRYLSDRQLNDLVQSHFHHGLETFELECEESDRVHVSMEILRHIKAKSPFLRRLLFRGCSLYPSAIDDMPNMIQHLSLRECTVDECTKSDIYMINRKEKLTCLDITGAEVTLPLKFLYASRLENLRWLYLENCGNISNRRIHSMVEILPQLYALDIEGNVVRNDGVRIILGCCTAIRELYIGRLYVDDGALFNCSIGKLPNLTTLCITGTYITQNGIRKFMRGCERDISIIGLDNLCPGPMPVLLSCRRAFDGCDHYLSHSCSS